jgi:5-hydroxyisourate hydrolase
MAGKLTTHALDTQQGCAAASLKVEVRRYTASAEDFTLVTLDAGGRGVLIEAGLETGIYEITFHVADYHHAKGVTLSDPPFFEEVTVRIGVSDAQAHYHVPLVFTPYSYSTYRGG